VANRGRSFLFLIAIAAVLGGYVWFVEMQRDPNAADAPPTVKLFTVEPAQIQEIRLTNSTGEQSTLRRTGTGWSIAEVPGADVDEAEVTNIATALSTLEASRVVDEQPPSLAEFGLDKPRIQASFTDGAGTQHALLIGSKTPTGGDLYAKLADSPRVLLIGSYLEESFDKSRFDLRDKTALKFARDAVGGITITSGTQTITLARSGGAWKITSPIDAPADDAAVEGLVGRLATARMQSIVDPAASVDTGLAKPVASVAVTAGPTRAQLEIGGDAGEGRVYARDAGRNLVFTVESALADELKKKPEDFRKKDQ
jgi:hypothetical protein